VDIHPEKRLRTSISMTKGDGNCNVDVDNNFSMSIYINNDLKKDCEGNLQQVLFLLILKLHIWRKIPQ